MSSSMSFDCERPVKDVRKMGDTLIVTLEGDVDMSCSPELRLAMMQVIDQRAKVVVIDTSKVPHMDSSGVATMIEALQRVKKYGGRLVLVGLQQRVHSIFEIAKLTDIFEIKSNLDEVVSDEQ